MTKTKNPRKAVEDTMLEVFAETFGFAPSRDEDAESKDGPDIYCFPLGGSSCHVAVMPCSERAASINVNVRLGRAYTGYPRALRWLAENRAANTVALTADERSRAFKELWISCNRVTLADDRQGIREMLLDIHDEVGRVEVGLRAWFPQVLGGLLLDEIEEAAAESDALAAVLGDPRGYTEWIRDNRDEARNHHGELPEAVFGWLGLWDECLVWNEQAWAATPDWEKSTEATITHLFRRCVALHGLGRHQELLQAAAEILGSSDEADTTAVATIRCCALHGLGRDEELLRLVRSSHYDRNPRIWFWRSLAHMKLGHLDESVGCFRRYEEVIGPDLCARRQLRALVADDGCEEG